MCAVMSVASSMQPSAIISLIGQIAHDYSTPLLQKYRVINLQASSAVIGRGVGTLDPFVRGEIVPKGEINVGDRHDSPHFEFPEPLQRKSIHSCTLV